MKMIPILLLVTYFIYEPIFCKKSQLLSQHETRTTSLSQCVVEASKHFFGKDVDTIIFSTSATNEMVLAGTAVKLLEDESVKCVLVKTTSYDHAARYGFGECGNSNINYIIHVRNRRQLIHLVGTLASLPSWNPHAGFLIVAAESFEKPHAVAIQFIETLWEKGIVKAAVLLPSLNNYTIFEVYSWNPFKAVSYKRRISPLDYCSFGRFENGRSWFDETIIKCFNNCTIKVNYVDWPPFVINAEKGYQSSNYITSQGLDVNLVNMIANKLNLTVVYSTTGALWGKIYENGSAQGNIGLLYNNSVDILIGGYRKTTSRMKYFDVTDSHVQLFEEWCVSNAPVIIGFRSMGNIFQIEVWISAIAFYLLIATWIYISYGRKNCKANIYQEFGNALIFNLAVFLGVGVNSLPRSAGSRYLTTLLILLGFYITLFYSSYLTSIISAPKYIQKYNSLKDIYDFNLNTYFQPDEVKWVLNDSSITSVIPLKLIKERWRNCYNLAWCFQKVAITKNSCFYTDNLVRGYMLATKNYTMHCIRHIKVGTPISLILRKGFPFYKQFNDMVNRILEAGILSKWKKDIFKHEIAISYDTSDNARIKFDNLTPIFLFLLVGNAISFVVFLIELISCHG